MFRRKSRVKTNERGPEEASSMRVYNSKPPQSPHVVAAYATPAKPSRAASSDKAGARFASHETLRSRYMCPPCSGGGAACARLRAQRYVRHWGEGGARARWLPEFRKSRGGDAQGAGCASPRSPRTCALSVGCFLPTLAASLPALRALGKPKFSSPPYACGCTTEGIPGHHAKTRKAPCARWREDLPQTNAAMHRETCAVPLPRVTPYPGGETPTSVPWGLGFPEGGARWGSLKAAARSSIAQSFASKNGR